ncbi:MAG: LPS-assembly protein LptD, partial [Nitrospira sp.]|nr:LPS-assembly protein LptD [Nitrospira sp.]
MTDPWRWICRRFVLGGALVIFLPGLPLGATEIQKPAENSSSGSTPLDITAAQLDYRKDQELYEAHGSVVVRQGTLTLTADHVTIQALTGALIATGRVHLTDPQTDVTGERLELNVNTEAGVVTQGQLFAPSRNSLVSGRLLQRFSEYHYRVKGGSFTNCDAQEGEVPAWRLRFEDADAIF